MTTLLTWRRSSPGSLQEALDEMQVILGEERQAVCLLSHPEWFRLGLLSGSVVSGPDGKAIPVAGVFEARVFTGEWELRWLQSEAGGLAVLLTEFGECKPEGEWEPGTGLAEVTPMEREYLVIGPLGPGQARERTPMVSEPVSGLMNGREREWSFTRSSRVARLHLPVSAAKGGAVLRTIEYVDREREHGNAYVTEERLIALEEIPWA